MRKLKSIFWNMLYALNWLMPVMYCLIFRSLILKRKSTGFYRFFTGFYFFIFGNAGSECCWFSFVTQFSLTHIQLLLEFFVVVVATYRTVQPRSAPQCCAPPRCVALFSRFTFSQCCWCFVRFVSSCVWTISAALTLCSVIYYTNSILPYFWI